MRKLRFKRDSPYQKIEIYDDHINGRRVRHLYLDSVEHSAIDLDSPDRPVWIYTDFVHLAWIFKKDSKRILVAGLGGGAMPMSLRRNHPRLVIDVVEIDSNIVSVANRYFGIKEDARLRIHTGDAHRYLKESDQTFDVIVLDVFKSKDNDLWMPPPLASVDFFRTAQKRLSRDGLIVLNLVGRLKGKARTTLAIIRKLEKLFPQVYLFPIFLKKAPNLEEERNIIVICAMDKKRLSSKTIIRRAQKLADGGRCSLRNLPEYAENHFSFAKN